MSRLKTRKFCPRPDYVTADSSLAPTFLERERTLCPRTSANVNTVQPLPSATHFFCPLTRLKRNTHSSRSIDSLSIVYTSSVYSTSVKIAFRLEGKRHGNFNGKHQSTISAVKYDYGFYRSGKTCRVMLL